MGSFEARVHVPKGRSVAGAAKASETARSSGTMNILGFRTCMFSDSSLRGLRILGWLEWHGADDAFSFFDENQLVGLDVLQSFHKAAGPANLQQLHLLCFANAEMDAQIILRKIAAAAAHFVDLRVKVFFARQRRDAFDARADVAVVVEISKRAAPRSHRRGDARSGVEGNVVKAPVAQIFVEQLSLRVARFRFEL